MSTKSSSLTPWDRWRKRRIVVTDPLTGKPVAIDRGVNFFVQALSNAGAQTRFSCEGHPTGFYVLFEAPLELAMKIRSAGFFSVELEGKGPWHPSWSIQTHEYPSIPKTAMAKCRRLRWAADAWIKAGLSADPELSPTGMAATSPAFATTTQERSDHVFA